MTEREYLNWKAITESSRFRWVEDDIYRLNGRGAFYYSGGEDGVYMRIDKDGTLTAGHYEGAIPHIGEAMFTEEFQKRYESWNAAYTAAIEAGGKQFLLDMLTTAAIELLPEEDAPPQENEETIDWQNTYVSPDFQSDQTEGFPASLCWDKNRGVAFLMLNESMAEDDTDMAHYEQLCEKFGSRPCDCRVNFNALLERLGDDAVDSAWLPDEDESEEYGGISLS
jgi:hypothetical protein